MSDDIRMARAAAKAEKARAKALRPWYRKKRWILSGALVALIAIMVAAGGHSATTSANANASSKHNGVKTLSLNATHPPQDDVHIRSCTVDEFGLAHAGLAITNHSSGRSDYVVSVAFDDGGVQIGTGDAFVQNVDGGQRAADDAEGSIAKSSPAHMSCSVKSVDRTASL